LAFAGILQIKLVHAIEISYTSGYLVDPISKNFSNQIIALVEGVRTFDRSWIKESFVVLDWKDSGTSIVYPAERLAVYVSNRLNELYQVCNRPEGNSLRDGRAER